MPTGHDLAMALRGAYLAMHRRVDARLTGVGVTADQFVVLNALAEDAAVTQRELARRTSSDPNTVRAMIVLLESRGLVARKPHPTDARARTVALTARGRKVRDAAWVACEPVRKDLLVAFAPGRAETFVKHLKAVIAAMTEPAAAAASDT